MTDEQVTDWTQQARAALDRAESEVLADLPLKSLVAVVFLPSQRFVRLLSRFLTPIQTDCLNFLAICYAGRTSEVGVALNCIQRVDREFAAATFPQSLRCQGLLFMMMGSTSRRVGRKRRRKRRKEMLWDAILAELRHFTEQGTIFHDPALSRLCSIHGGPEVLLDRLWGSSAIRDAARTETNLRELLRLFVLIDIITPSLPTELNTNHGVEQIWLGHVLWNLGLLQLPIWFESVAEGYASIDGSDPVDIFESPEHFKKHIRELRTNIHALLAQDTQAPPEASAALFTNIMSQLRSLSAHWQPAYESQN